MYGKRFDINPHLVFISGGYAKATLIITESNDDSSLILTMSTSQGQNNIFSMFYDYINHSISTNKVNWYGYSPTEISFFNGNQFTVFSNAVAARNQFNNIGQNYNYMAI